MVKNVCLRKRFSHYTIAIKMKVVPVFPYSMQKSSFNVSNCLLFSFMMTIRMTSTFVKCMKNHAQSDRMWYFTMTSIYILIHLECYHLFYWQVSVCHQERRCYVVASCSRALEARNQLEFLKRSFLIVSHKLELMEM